jgi:hypothetical protein
MKPLPILGFALALSFLAPLAQAAPVPAPSPEPPRVEAPAPTAAERTDPAPHPDQPHGDRGYIPVPVVGRDHDHNSPAQNITITTAPDSDEDQDSAPSDDTQDVPTTDDSCASATAGTEPAHYSMDDLVYSMSSLDAPYDSVRATLLPGRAKRAGSDRCEVTLRFLRLRFTPPPGQLVARATSIMCPIL